jgi:hypothetical protein
VWLKIERSARFTAVFTLFLFCKKEATNKISVMQQKQEGSAILHITNALRNRIFPTYLGYS